MSSCCSTTSPAATPAAPPGSGMDGARAADWIRLGVAAFVAAQSMAFGLAVNVSPPEGAERAFIHALLAGSALFVFLVIGLPILRNAWLGLRARRVNMDQFFLLGITGAFAASLQATFTGKGSLYYEVVAVLVAIHTLGRILGERRKTAAVEAARRLRAEFDSCWKLTCCGRELRVPVAEIQPGDTVRVRGGEGVPVDGILREGTAFVRETAFTGETFPVVKRPGDTVLAGSKLEDGLVTIEAAQPGSARRLDHLLRSLDLAGAKKSSLQREADRIVQWFLPAVATAAALIFIGWTFAAGWETALIHALAAIVVACPCALGLATPLAVWNALNHLARKGVVVKSGEGLERLAAVTAAVFDKTGTLSSEAPAVVDFLTAEGFSREEVRQWIGRAQSGSLHPVARAFASWSASAIPAGSAAASGGEPARPVPLTEIPGAGIAASLPQGVLKIGNDGILPDDPRARDEAARLASSLLGRAGAGVKTFYVTLNDRVIAAAALRETLRGDTAETVRWFESAGITAHIMTGDPDWTAPEGLGLPPDRIRTGLRPEDKARLVEEMARNGQKVLFVGDGLNDAPAMRAAHASLAMGGGAELSRETASGEIFGARLSAAAETVRVARLTVRAMRGNMLYALIYNCAGISLAAAGILHPVVAAIIMLVSSVTVSWRALNALGPEEEDTAMPAPSSATPSSGASGAGGCCGSSFQPASAPDTATPLTQPAEQPAR